MKIRIRLPQCDGITMDKIRFGDEVNKVKPDSSSPRDRG